MSEFEFSGNDLIIRWEIRGFQLFDYLEKGLLQPYDATTGNMIIDRNTDHGKKIMESFKRTPPLTVEKQEKKQRANQIKYYGFVHSGRGAKRKAQALYNYHIVRLNDCIQKTFTLSRDEKEAVKQIREAKKWVFKTDDVLRFEQDHALYKSNNPEKIKLFPCEAGTKIDLPAIIEANRPVSQDLASLLSSQMQNIGERAFILKGDNWYVKYDGNDNTIKALPRIRYIVRLLEKPNNKFPHRELYSLIGNQCDDINEDYSKMSKEELNAEGLSENLTMIDCLNNEELEKLKEVIYEQHIKLKFNKPNSKEEWESTKKHLLDEHGVKMFYTHSGPYFKLMCRLTEDFEKPRSNATNNILNAMRDIEKKMPALHAHLKQHIKTGGTCRYEIQEDELIPWDIRWE